MAAFRHELVIHQNTVTLRPLRAAVLLHVCHNMSDFTEKEKRAEPVFMWQHHSGHGDKANISLAELHHRAGGYNHQLCSYAVTP